MFATQVCSSACKSPSERVSLWLISSPLASDCKKWAGFISATACLAGIELYPSQRFLVGTFSVLFVSEYFFYILPLKENVYFLTSVSKYNSHNNQRYWETIRLVSLSFLGSNIHYNINIVKYYYNYIYISLMQRFIVCFIIPVSHDPSEIILTC